MTVYDSVPLPILCLFQVFRVTTRVGGKVQRLTKILSRNVNKCGLFFNVASLALHLCLLLAFQCLNHISQKNL